jgi:hypothetical protein
VQLLRAGPTRADSDRCRNAGRNNHDAAAAAEAGARAANALITGMFPTVTPASMVAKILKLRLSRWKPE